MKVTIEIYDSDFKKLLNLLSQADFEISSIEKDLHKYNGCSPWENQQSQYEKAPWWMNPLTPPLEPKCTNDSGSLDPDSYTTITC